jgi:very-short-patch-repair endonuclease
MALAAAQHGLVTRRQLLDLGFSPEAIKHRIRRGRLHPIFRGVYAVGRPGLSQEGQWMAAVLACGAGAVLSHLAAGGLYRIVAAAAVVDVSIPLPQTASRPGVRIHRRIALAPSQLTEHVGIPVTTPAQTLIDLATLLEPDALEAAIIEADKRELATPDAVRASLDELGPLPGTATLRTLLDRRTFILTDSHLERRFPRIARRAGLPQPLTGRRVNGFKVDFYWPDLGLVVETDGLRYHRTPQQQARDARRDQAHTAAGLTPLRFTHAQVAYDAATVESILRRTARRLARD